MKKKKLDLCIEMNLLGSNMQKREGFTLIELMIVVAMIGVLLTLVFPNTERIRQRAGALSCKSNLKGLTLAVQLYANDNGDRLPGSGTGCNNGRPRCNDWVLNTGHGATRRDWLEGGSLWEYIKNESAYKCATIDRSLKANNVDISIYKRHYSMNYFINGENHAWYPARAYYLSDVIDPINTHVFIEEFDPRNANWGSWVMRLFEDRWVDPVSVYHNYGSAFSFADGHAEFWEWQDPRTASVPTSFFVSHPGSPDIRRMQQHAMPGHPAGPNPGGLNY